MARNSVVERGRLTIPLFHGPSSRYYDSICSAGLGGRNVVEEMYLAKEMLLYAPKRARDLLKERPLSGEKPKTHTWPKMSNRKQHVFNDLMVGTAGFEPTTSTV